MKGDAKRLDELIFSLLRNESCQLRIPNPDISFLANSAKDLFLKEPTVLELHPPLCVCGDVHGQFPDLLRIFEMAEPPPNNRFLFLGDYVDRGPMGLEILCLLLAMKLRYPNHIYLLRGNHETREMTAQYGFMDECVSKTNKSVYSEICDMFDTIPIAAVIGGSFFCVHGGITPTLKKIDQVREIARPADASYKGFLADLLWSDPNPNVDDWGPNDRGDTVCWNVKPVREFLEANNLRMLIRAHQMVEHGFEYPFDPDECCLTVFSAPCYAGEYKNRGAFIVIDKGMNVMPHVLPHKPFSMATANKVAASTRKDLGNPGGKGGNPGGKGGKGKGKGKKDDKGKRGKKR